jgi:hypothetical protein
MGTNIAYAQIYCTVDEVIGDLGLTGDEPMLLSRIRSASRHILNTIGNFVPIGDTRNFLAGPSQTLNVFPLLAASAVTDYQTAIAASGYRLSPQNQLWLNGPYQWIEKTAIYDTRVWPDINAGLCWDVNGVSILGKWGLYEELADLGIVATQLVGDKSLVVTDGSVLSAGMVLLIDSEQELVTAGNGGPGSADGTLASSQVTAALTADTEVVSVTNGAEFHAGEVFRVEFEDFKIRKIAGNVLLCSRGWNGSMKNTHLINSAIYIYRTFTVSRAMNGTVAAGHTSAAVSRFVIPEDVNWLVREVAGLMRMKAKVNFAAKSGNAELGEAFYFNEFPKQIEVIKNNYRLP